MGVVDGGCRRGPDAVRLAPAGAPLGGDEPGGDGGGSADAPPPSGAPGGARRTAFFASFEPDDFKAFCRQEQELGVGADGGAWTTPVDNPRRQPPLNARIASRKSSRVRVFLYVKTRRR
jgi:hypothetical protein